MRSFLLLILFIGLCQQGKASQGYVAIPGTCRANWGNTCNLTLSGLPPSNAIVVINRVDVNANNWGNQECVSTDDCGFGGSVVGSPTYANGNTITVRPSCHADDGGGSIGDAHCRGDADLSVVFIINANDWLASFSVSPGPGTVANGTTVVITFSTAGMGGTSTGGGVGAKFSSGTCSVNGTTQTWENIYASGDCTATVDGGFVSGGRGWGGPAQGAWYDGYRMIGGVNATIRVTFSTSGARTFIMQNSNFTPLVNGTLGTWTYVVPNTAPIAVGVSGVPANVNYGTWFNVTFVCRDPDGWSTITYCRVIVGFGISDSYTCDLIWFGGNTLGNYNGSSWQAQTPGTGGATADNSACTLDIANSSATWGGTDITVVARVRPKPAMLVSGGSGLASWMNVQDNYNVETGWILLGSTGTLRSGPKLIVTQNR